MTLKTHSIHLVLGYPIEKVTSNEIFAPSKINIPVLHFRPFIDIMYWHI